jgi:hypothetical protein
LLPLSYGDPLGKRDLGKALLQFHQEHRSFYPAYDAPEGLSEREVEKLLKGRQ